MPGLRSISSQTASATRSLRPTEQNGAAVLYLTVHAEEQIGTEAVDDSTIPEETAEMEQVP